MDVFNFNVYASFSIIESRLKSSSWRRILHSLVLFGNSAYVTMQQFSVYFLTYTISFQIINFHFTFFVLIIWRYLEREANFINQLLKVGAKVLFSICLHAVVHAVNKF